MMDSMTLALIISSITLVVGGSAFVVYLRRLYKLKLREKNGVIESTAS